MTDDTNDATERTENDASLETTALNTLKLLETYHGAAVLDSQQAQNQANFIHYTAKVEAYLDAIAALSAALDGADPTSDDYPEEDGAELIELSRRARLESDGPTWGAVGGEFPMYPEIEALADRREDAGEDAGERE